MSGDEPPKGEGPNVVLRLLQVITPGFVRRSFAIKFGLVLLVMAASIGVIGMAATQAIAAETEVDVQSDFRSVATQESDIIQEWLERNRLSATLISDSSVWDTDDPEALQRSLNGEMSDLSTDVLEMHLLDGTEDGYVVAGSTSMQAGASVAESSRAWMDPQAGNLAGLKASDVEIRDTYAVGSERVVGFLSPTSVRQDRILLVEVSVSQITSSLQGSQRDGSATQNGFTQVVNGSNTVIIDARSDGETSLLQPYSEDDEALEPLRRASDIRGTRTSAGVITNVTGNDVIDETYTVGYGPVENLDWVVLTHAPRSEVFGFVQSIQRYGLFATVAAILLIGVTGTMLGYSTSRSIDRLTAKTEEMQEGDLDVTFYTSRVDNIGRLYAGFADMRDSLKEQIREAERSRKEAEVARAEAEEMTAYLQEKTTEYSEIMQQCAAGDLTRRMSKDGEEESMDRIADEFNQMIEELEKTTGQLKSYVDEVEQAGAEVEQSTNTVREASEQVADSIQRISDGAYDQKERLQNVSETMDGVATRLEAFADERPEVDFEDSLREIRQIAGALEETADLSEKTMGEAENVAGAAEEQAAELTEVGERAHDLQRYAQPLRDILERFETEAEHEFVFSVGPTGGTATPTVDDGGGDGDEPVEPADEE